MKKLGVSLMAALFVLAAAQQTMAAKGGKKKAEKAEKATGPAPIASAEAISEIRGDYKWGMSVQQVLDKIKERIEGTYKDRLKRAAQDPAKTDRLRREMQNEVKEVTKTVVKFDGQKGAWDVSIIGPEVVQNQGQSMLFVKEKTSTRYFFFANDSLYKMYIAFDKDMLAGKSFKEFGEAMQTKFGKAQEVYVDRATPGRVERRLEHYQWRSAAGDGLRLTDRSEFYDVYCLVLFDGAVEQRMASFKKSSAEEGSGSVLDGVLSGKQSDRDENDNVIDRITGKEVIKPGERRGNQGNIVVPSTSGGSKSNEGSSGGNRMRGGLE